MSGSREYCIGGAATSVMQFIWKHNFINMLVFCTTTDFKSIACLRHNVLMCTRNPRLQRAGLHLRIVCRITCIIVCFIDVDSITIKMGSICTTTRITARLSRRWSDRSPSFIPKPTSVDYCARIPLIMKNFRRFTMQLQVCISSMTSVL